MALIKNSNELRKLYRYNLCGGDRPTIADSIRASHDTPYNEGVNVGKDLVTIYHDEDSRRACCLGIDGGYIVCGIINSYLGVMLAKIYVDRIVLLIDYRWNRSLGIGGVTLTRAAAVNFLCGVMDGINEAVEFSNIIKVELHAVKDTTTGDDALFKFSIGEVEYGPEEMVTMA